MGSFLSMDTISFDQPINVVWRPYFYSVKNEVKIHQNRRARDKYITVLRRELKRKDMREYLFEHGGRIPTVKRVIPLGDDKVCVVLIYSRGTHLRDVSRSEFVRDIKEGLFKVYHAGQELLTRDVAIGIDMDSVDACMFMRYR